MNYTTSTNCIFPVYNFAEVRNKVLNWVGRFSTFCFLDNHQYQLPHHSAECIAAAGTARFLEANGPRALDRLQAFIDQNGGWLFGHLAYDLGNEPGKSRASHEDGIQFPDLFFFRPRVVVQLEKNRLKITSENDDEEMMYREIMTAGAEEAKSQYQPIVVSSRLSRQDYISIVCELKKHIVRGDCYEINFCQEFFSENVLTDPLTIYKRLSAISPNPFSAFYRLTDKYLVCASPERFLKKTGNSILSQPIKGTSKRSPYVDKDTKSRQELLESPKERSENVMVVDLVRNDLSKICKEGTVQVDELYGIYSFPQVHQMISTVSGTLKDEISFDEIIKATFPMGSMTGAPKKRVMELIAEYEMAKRGIFSGALGYINPDGDFDFNVVIRSIMYNESLRYLSFQAGSGITFYSDAEKEWIECEWKAAAMRSVLEGDRR